VVDARGLVLIVVLGCEPEQPPPRPPPPEETPAERFEDPPPDVVYAPREEPETNEVPQRLPEPAFSADPDYASDEDVTARRLVYRATLRVPASLGIRDPSVPSTAAELHIDVARDRLRARFVGNGWPVESGSEVRLRRDQPGVYVFDGEGGRNLGPGQLAQWYEGGRLRFEPRLRVSTPDEQAGPGDLICRLIAEWTNSSPDTLARRCGEGGAPPSFRVGLWRHERTGDVAIRMPRSALRADHEDPPDPIADETWRPFLTPQMMARLPRGRNRPNPDDDAPAEGMVVRNRSRSRMLVTVQGTPIGWLDAGTEAHFEAIRPGIYSVGAMRPFGLQAARKRPVTVPGRVRLPW